MFSKMKKASMLSALFLTMAFAAPAFATGGGATATAGADASAGASAVSNIGKSFGSASIAVADCTQAVVLGPIAIGGMHTTCERLKLAEYFVFRGAYDIADELVAGAPLANQAIRNVQKRNAVEKKAAAVSMPNYVGKWKYLSRTQKSAVDNCKAMWNGKRTAKCATN